jgi:hypothetical protein
MEVCRSIMTQRGACSTVAKVKTPKAEDSRFLTGSMSGARRCLPLQSLFPILVRSRFTINDSGLFIASVSSSRLSHVLINKISLGQHGSHR